MPLIRKAFKRLHYPIDVIAQCVRWYLAYALSLRNLEEMMAERGIIVDHSTLHRWVIRLVPLLDKAFRRRKRTVGRRWRIDETYIKIKGQWKYLYRAVDTDGQTIDFLLTARRDAATPPDPRLSADRSRSASTVSPHAHHRCLTLRTTSFFGQGDATQRVLRDVIVDLRPPITAVQVQCIPLLQQVRERLRRI